MVDVVVPVGLKPGWVQEDARVWTESTKILAGFGLHDQGSPSAAIFGGLVLQTLTNLVETVCLHTRDMRGRTGIVFQGQGDGQRGDEVDVADVDEQFPAVVGKFTECKVRVDVWVRWIED